HPLTRADLPLAEAIEAERQLLKPISECADWIIDTTRTNIHQLRELVRNRVQGGEEDDGLSLLFQSFGFKYGMPGGMDFVFDARCLPNPHWEAELREQTGRDAGVALYLESQQDTLQMAEDIIRYLETWLPKFRANDRSYVTIGIGCTGGKHRSVYLVERLAKHFADKYPQTTVRHTELP
ncbi:MAG: RNase adapter RapZ, partial [Salinisphaeraceae bacterium]|nr:RNase adapter RapZ [Salinisphaeraceae bacterium]